MPRRTATRSRLHLDRASLVRGVVAAMWTVAIVVVLVGGIWGVPALIRHAEATERFAEHAGDATILRVVFRSVPPWMTGRELERLELLVAEAVDSTVLDRTGLIVAREALLRTGWFESVDQVRRLDANRVEVLAHFTEPFAVIRDADGEHLVDPDGRLLPLSWPVGTQHSLPRIVHAAAERPRRFGDPWPGADVAAALAVLTLIDNRPWAGQAVAVDLGGRGRTDTVRLLTDRGGTIRWGRPPGAEGTAEPAASAKIAFLDHHHRHYGHIDGGLDGELDISGDVAVLRR